MGSETRKPGFQFSLRFLLLLTLVVAVFLSVNRAIAVACGGEELLKAYVSLVECIGSPILLLSLLLIGIYAVGGALSAVLWVWERCRARSRGWPAARLAEDKPTREPASADGVNRAQEGSSSLRFVRWVLYSHLVGLTASAACAFLYLQRGSLAVPDVAVWMLFVPGLLTFYACPAVVSGAIAVGRLGGRHAKVVCVAEAGIEFVQLLALMAI